MSSLKIVSFILLMVLLAIGFNLARHKPLWTDEIYSQTVSVEKFSYPDILLGKVKEGNTCPLFYLIQKMICDMTQYRVPSTGLEPWDQHAQILLRVNPVFFMSLAIAVIFYCIARFYSSLAGVFASFVALSSPMVWLYWAESRPYAMWVLLGTLQLLFFLSIIRKEELNIRTWNWLAVIHGLLSLTVITSVGQIMAVSFLLWILKSRDWKKYLGLTILPLLICFYYYGRSSLSPLWVPNNFMKLIYPSISVEQRGLFAVYTTFLLVQYFQSRGNAHVLTIGKEERRSWALIALMLAVAFSYIIFYKLREIPGHAGHELPVRQFIFLTPVGIIATVLFSLDLMRAVKNQMWIRINVALALGGLMIIHFLRNCFGIIGIY